MGAHSSSPYEASFSNSNIHAPPHTSAKSPSPQERSVELFDSAPNDSPPRVGIMLSCGSQLYTPPTISDLLTRAKFVALNPVARNVFIKYLNSGNWLNEAFNESVKQQVFVDLNPKLFPAKETEKYLGYAMQQQEYLHIHHLKNSLLSPLRSLRSSLRKSSSKKLSDIFPQFFKLSAVAIALNIFMQSPLYFTMFEKQWDVDSDAVVVSPRNKKPSKLSLSSLFGPKKTKHSIQLDKLRETLWTSINKIEMKSLDTMLSSDEWVYSLQSEIQELPFSISYFAIQPNTGCNDWREVCCNQSHEMLRHQPSFAKLSCSPGEWLSHIVIDTKARAVKPVKFATASEATQTLLNLTIMRPNYNRFQSRNNHLISVHRDGFSPSDANPHELRDLDDVITMLAHLN